MGTIQISRVLTMPVTRCPRTVRGCAVVVREQMDDLERLLDSQMLARVVQALHEHLGLALVLGDVVADLDCPDRAAFVALADRLLGDDRRDARR